MSRHKKHKDKKKLKAIIKASTKVHIPSSSSLEMKGCFLGFKIVKENHNQLYRWD